MCTIDYDLEPFEVWDETRRKARKEHECTCCSGPIRPGETYLVHFSVAERGCGATSEKMCPRCLADRDAFAEEHEGTFTSPSGFEYLLDECIQSGEPGSEKWRPVLARIHRRLPAPLEPKP